MYCHIRIVERSVYCCLKSSIECPPYLLFFSRVTLYDELKINTLNLSTLHFEHKIMRRPFIFSLNKEMSDKILSLISKVFDMSDSRYR